MARLTLGELTIFFAFLSLVFTVITLTFAGVKMSGGPGDDQAHQNEKDSFFDTGDVCVTCSKLVNEHGEKNPMLDQLTKKINKNVEMCCAEDGEQLAVLGSMVAQRVANMSGKSLPAQYNLSKLSPVTAHKSLIAGDWGKGEAFFFDENKGTRPAKLNHTYNNPLTEHVRGLKVAEDGFVIPYSGYYYVYASLLFKPNSTKAPKDFLYTLCGYIYRKSPDRPAHEGYLIKMCHKLCDDCKDDEETVFSGGFMNLHADDVIQVHVTGRGFVEFNQESSYFGLVMLASEDKTSTT